MNGTTPLGNSFSSHVSPAVPRLPAFATNMRFILNGRLLNGGLEGASQSFLQPTDARKGHPAHASVTSATAAPDQLGSEIRVYYYNLLTQRTARTFTHSCLSIYVKSDYFHSFAVATYPLPFLYPLPLFCILRIRPEH
ncbi:hypothetical protein BC938DRAFT_479792 [Jimgerdemannia flammicorona]|uniref:Uncharacterized protein n=1 Tax=Jimgerdemannia flammicorona TaxID=994334 RepID=A0A433QXN5_9FUNG|nr:hypothetical protein BC938DRAFT_479792 [Jimgerdemannia flammicorona]